MGLPRCDKRTKVAEVPFLGTEPRVFCDLHFAMFFMCFIAWQIIGLLPLQLQVCCSFCHVFSTFPKMWTVFAHVYGMPRCEWDLIKTNEYWWIHQFALQFSSVHIWFCILFLVVGLIIGDKSINKKCFLPKVLVHTIVSYVLHVGSPFISITLFHAAPSHSTMRFWQVWHCTVFATARDASKNYWHPHTSAEKQCICLQVRNAYGFWSGSWPAIMWTYY